MDKIPTAEEYLCEIPDFSIEHCKIKDSIDNLVSIKMIEFAKLHVKAALEAAHDNLQLPEQDLAFTLESYSLDNIK